jgi:hypothetical protein
MNDIVCKGVLTTIPGQIPFLSGDDGTGYLKDEKIWSGYLLHWNGLKVSARALPQKDYETGRNIIILWPDEPLPEEPFVDLYFNERLVKYPVSFLGHLAVNVHGEIFNYSHLINENEVMKPEEYFYRPALGEFAPHPKTCRNNTDDPEKPYYDKFGRLFMRTIHVLRITGLDTKRLSHFFHSELEIIHNTPPDSAKPGHYRDFNILTNNCATIIRNGFKKTGFHNIRGIFPRDLFVNASYYFLRQSNNPMIRASGHTRHQLHVPEAASSALPPLLNPVNRVKYFIMKKYATSAK